MSSSGARTKNMVHGKAKSLDLQEKWLPAITTTG